METLILICLILVIVLLLHDKIQPPKEKLKKPNKHVEQQLRIENIMGQPKVAVRKPDSERDMVSSLKTERYAEDNVVEEKNFLASSEAEDDPEVNYDEEEEEWRYYSYIQDDQGFAQGVTFEELQSFHNFVKNEQSETTNNGQLLETAKKIQGTELFSLMQSSVEDASKKIAQLLDSTLDSPNIKLDNAQNSFDINDYL